MTLIITAVAATSATAVRFAQPGFGARHHIGLLALIYWGATVMWAVDWVAALTSGASLANLVVEDLGSETWLGLCVVALGLAVYAVARAIRARRPA